MSAKFKSRKECQPRNTTVCPLHCLEAKVTRPLKWASPSGTLQIDEICIALTAYSTSQEKWIILYEKYIWNMNISLSVQVKNTSDDKIKQLTLSGSALQYIILRRLTYKNQMAFSRCLLGSSFLQLKLLKQRVSELWELELRVQLEFRSEGCSSILKIIAYGTIFDLPAI